MNKAVAHWFWIDPNCFNSHNTAIKQALALLNIPIKRYSSFNTFKNEFESMVQKQQNWYGSVVCSAHLPSQAYEFLQGHKNIEEMIVFCFKRNNGLRIRQRYKKIKRVIVRDDALIDYVLGNNGWKAKR